MRNIKVDIKLMKDLELCDFIRKISLLILVRKERIRLIDHDHDSYVSNSPQNPYFRRHLLRSKVKYFRQ